MRLPRTDRGRLVLVLVLGSGALIVRRTGDAPMVGSDPEASSVAAPNTVTVETLASATIPQAQLPTYAMVTLVRSAPVGSTSTM